MFPAFTIPACDEPEFARLPADERHAWFEMREAMTGAVGAPRPLAYLDNLAAAYAREGRGKGMSRKTLIRVYYRVRSGETWRCMCDMRKLSGGGRSRWVTAEFLAWWRAECARWTRGAGGWGGVAGAHRELIRKYRAGETLGGICWTQVWDELHGSRFDRPEKCPPDFELPPGWGYEQLCRRKAPKAFMIAASQGKGEARALMAQVHTTRRGLQPGQLYAFDDLWHDFDVVYKAKEKSQIVRILELCCIDVASAYKCMALFRPRVRDEVTGKRSNLCEADMELGVTHLLSSDGYNRDRCTLMCEGGTAHLGDDFVRRLSAATGGVVTVEWSKPDRSPALAGHWLGPAKGNPKAKRWVESSHNLSHNVLANLPGQLGPDSRNAKPEWVEARTRAVQFMIDVADGRMTYEEAEALAFPLLRYDDAVKMILEAYEQIHLSRDHRLEGWQDNRKLRWRTNPGDAWHDMEELQDFDPVDRAMIETVIRSRNSRYVEDVALNRKERWQEGRNSHMLRLPAHVAAALLFNHAKPRKVPERAEMFFEDYELEDAPMGYRLAECLDPAGVRVRLEPGSDCHFLINPFDMSRRLHVMSRTGQYFGSVPRIDPAALIDPLAVEAMVKTTAEAVNRQLTEIKRIGLPITQDRLRVEQVNLGVLTNVVENRRGLVAAASAESGDARSRRRAATKSLVEAE